MKFDPYSFRAGKLHARISAFLLREIRLRFLRMESAEDGWAEEIKRGYRGVLRGRGGMPAAQDSSRQGEA